LRISETKPPTARKTLVVCSIALNLGFLGYFKYTNFALESIASLAPWFGGQAHFTPLDIFLPIGISFHVFQSMSYVIDTFKAGKSIATAVGTRGQVCGRFPETLAVPTNLIPSWQYQNG
jgi:alginate O-acetyltransferase complex protein AlgI